MTAYISGVQFLSKDEECKKQHEANLFCESLFGDPRVPINKLMRHVDIDQYGIVELKPGEFSEPVMKGMAAGEQRFIGLKVQLRTEQARYFSDTSWAKPTLLLLHEGRTEQGLPSRSWSVKYSHDIFRDIETEEYLEPAKIMMLLSTGLYTHYQGTRLYQVKLYGSDHSAE